MNVLKHNIEQTTSFILIICTKRFNDRYKKIWLYFEFEKWDCLLGRRLSAVATVIMCD